MTKDTYHTRTITIVDDELGGRFKKRSPAVVGSTSAPSYPQLPDRSSFAKGIDEIVGVEPPIGADDLGGSMAPSDAALSSGVETSNPPKPNERKSYDEQ